MAYGRTAGLRPESFLFRLSQKEEKRKGELLPGELLSCQLSDCVFDDDSSVLSGDAPHSQNDAPAAPPLAREDAELVEQLRKVRTCGQNTQRLQLRHE